MSEEELEDRVAEALGVLQWPLADVMTLTWPQLLWLIRKAGRILYPRVKPQRDALFSKLGSERGPKGEPSAIDLLIQDYERNRDAVARGEAQPLTPEQERRAYARRIFDMEYLGSPEQTTKPSAVQIDPLPGMTRDTARAIREWAVTSCPPDVYAMDVAPIIKHIQATETRGSESDQKL